MTCALLWTMRNIQYPKGQLVISNTTNRRPPTSEEDIDMGDELEGEVLRGWSGA